MIKQILIFADLHGKLPKISKKWRNKDTIIILAGDIANNYPEQTFTPGYMSGDVFTPTNWHMWNFRKIDTVLESELQSGWVQTKLIPHLIDNNISLDNVIAINGNHDFFDTSKLFKNGLDIGTKTVTIQGIQFGLVTGVMKYQGEWFQEISEEEIAKRLKNLDQDIDILVTHSPPYGIRDMGYGNRIGSNEIVKSIFGYAGKPPHFTKVRYHLFGHAHGQYGVDKHELNGRVIRFVNAAEQRMIIDIDPETW